MKSTIKKIKVSLSDDRYQPEDNLIKAKVEEPIAGYGRRIAFNNRYTAVVDTGVFVNELPAGHILRFSLVSRLADKGMVMTTTAFSGTGQIQLALVNCGREIVNLLDGETLAHVWLEKSEEFTWGA